MGQFDDLPHLLVITDRSVAVFLHVRLDGCNPCLIVSQKLSKVPIGFPDVTRAATRYKVAEPVFPQCPLVDGNNVIHDQIVLGTAICAETTELINLNSAVGARKYSVKLLVLIQYLCLEISKMVNPFGEAL